jgi:hypothetical protein
MRRLVGAAFAALVVFSLAPGVAHAGKHGVPARVAEARAVAFGYELGDRFVSDAASTAEPVLGPAEQRALRAVREEFRRWGRYTVVARPEEADLLVAIRLGRAASHSGVIGNGASNGSGGLGGAFDSGGGVRRGSSYNVDTSADDDMLVVYDGVEGRVGKRLWRASKEDGLAGDPPALVAKFRTDVERTPAPAGKGETKPPQ